MRTGKAGSHGLSEVSHVPASTLWHRANGRPSREEKAANQQYLTTSEEDALANDILRMAKNGYPPPVKFLPLLAGVLRRRRSPSDTSTGGCVAKQPSPSSVRGFLRRHPKVKARRSKPIDWKRHDYNIRSKVEEWFSVIGSELHDPAIDPANVYNMDKTGVMLSGPSSLKVLVGEEYTDGRALHPVIIWPATTHRSTWTTHPTPNWHFACSKSGYTDSAISIYWIKHVFDPQTRAQAGNKPRLLISDGFGTHESMKVLEFCFQNNIIPCRLPSHTSHKLQPCDVGVFSSLKTAYRELAESLDRGGAGSIGKQHFTYLYTVAVPAMKPSHKVLRNVQKPPENIADLQRDAGINVPQPSSDEPPVTPVTFDGICFLRKTIEEDVCSLDARGKLCLQKMLNATEKAFSEHSLLLQRNQELFQQNNEKKIRQGVKSTVVGKAKVMKYEDIVEAKRKREEKKCTRALRKRKTRRQNPDQGESVEGHAPRPIEEYCSVLQF
ncbi:hypothetical protein N7523_005565 [Penicillium sp. IBT 18751x]|nr:hypothetical protein N7523_005565 [Penicillium sp. IBT 18751x]